jgi:nucleotide-binding universal stress UspA family protein
MSTIRSILYPTDFSPSAACALPIACALARDYGARLLVLHVVAPRLLTLGGNTLPTRPEAYQEQVGELRRRLEAESFPAAVEAQVSAGGPAAEILRVAREGPCDLIVMGTHGRTGLGRVLMGSVADEVVRKAGCPVLTVKVPLAESQSAAGPGPAEAGRAAAPLTI